MDINTDLTRGRVFAGESFVNPQTRSASLGGYYGYYHSIRHGAVNSRVTFDMLASGRGFSLSVFLENLYMNRHRGRHKGIRLRSRHGHDNEFDFTKALTRACRVYNFGCPGPVSLHGFIMYNGYMSDARISDSFQDYDYDVDYDSEVDEFCRKPFSLSYYLKLNRTARDFNKFFVLHGTFFYELESGNMETASGALAYDSDETFGLRFVDRVLESPEPLSDEELIRQDAEDERERASLYILNDFAAQQLMLAAEQDAVHALQAVSQAVSSSAPVPA